METVLKYRLSVQDEQRVSMPEGAELLHVAEQNGEMMLWARVATSGRPEVQRIVLIRGTGHAAPNEPYVGTVLTQLGLVWHVFDGGEETI